MYMCLKRLFFVYYFIYCFCSIQCICNAQYAVSCMFLNACFAHSQNNNHDLL